MLATLSGKLHPTVMSRHELIGASFARAESFDDRYLKMEKLKQLLAEYGPVAITIYLVLFAAVFVGAYVAIHAGWSPTGVVGNAGAWAGAYVVAKLTQPLRIGATVLVTPLVARLWRRAPAAKVDADVLP